MINAQIDTRGDNKRTDVCLLRDYFTNLSKYDWLTNY